MCLVEAWVRGSNKCSGICLSVSDCNSFAGTDALAAFLSDELELYKQPKKYLVFQEFPVNERGKTDLKSIKKMAENDIETK